MRGKTSQHKNSIIFNFVDDPTLAYLINLKRQTMFHMSANRIINYLIKMFIKTIKQVPIHPIQVTNRLL